MNNPPDFEVIFGTYEEFLLGYRIQVNNKKLELKQSFATHEHSSSLRTVTTCGKYLASGGADDRICVYDMVQRKEHVMLTHHNSTVNCLEFTTGNTHLISASTDGSLYITRVGNWVIEKLWEKGHKNGYVIALAVHPTGKLALTLGSDCCLQTWNLIKGRKAYIINLNSKSTDARSLSFLKWGPDGEKFLLGGGDNLEIWNITTGGILKKFNYKIKLTCAAWLTEKLIVMGNEEGKLTVLDIESEDFCDYNAYSNRVKCLEYKKNCLITASSSGVIKIWCITDTEAVEDTLNEVCSTNTGCRITCICIVDGIKVKKEEKMEVAPIIAPVKPIIMQSRIIVEEGSSDEETNETKKQKIEIIYKSKLKKSKTQKTNQFGITETKTGEKNESKSKRKSKIRKTNQFEITETDNKEENESFISQEDQKNENKKTSEDTKTNKKKQNKEHNQESGKKRKKKSSETSELTQEIKQKVSKQNIDTKNEKKKKNTSFEEMVTDFEMIETKVKKNKKKKHNTSTEYWDVQ